MSHPVLRVALIAALVASPFVMVRALASGNDMALAAALAGLQGYVIARTLPGCRGTWAVVGGIVPAGLVLAFPAQILGLWPGIPHAVVYAALLVVFARSLAPRREPLVTRFARLVRGQLTAELQAYTRRVTLVWCMFFGAQIATSAVLLALAPRPAWIWFVTAVNLPLVGILFMGEYAYRCWRWRTYPPESLRDMARLFGRMRAEVLRDGPGT